MQIVKRLWRSESVLDCKMQCDEVNMYMFVFMLDSLFSVNQRDEKETCDCLQKEGADICSLLLLFVWIYLCLNIFHERSGLEVLKGKTLVKF